MPILGLMDTEQFAAERFKNVRRTVMYHYPTGASPLLGLLSMLDEETTNDPEFSWYTKTLNKQYTTGRTATPVTTDAPTGPGWAGGTSLGASAPADQTTFYWLKVVDSTFMRVGHVLLNGTTKQRWEVVEITNRSDTLGVVKVRAVNLVANVAAAGQGINVVGSVAAQGARSTDGIGFLPVNSSNNTQIFRTPFVPITGTAAKTAAKYDEKGPRPDLTKEHMLYHTTEIEKAFFFGTKAKVLVPNEGPRYYTGGVLDFLPVGSNDDDDTGRVIANADGIVNEDDIDNWYERAFRVVNNKANEKIAFCGSGYLKTMNQIYKGSSTLMMDVPSKDSYGMDVVKHITPYGTIYYKTHPLFNQDPAWRYNCMILDVHNLKYRYIEGRDGVLRENIQDNDSDYRKDEWLTEAGLEINFPDSHMYIQNVRSFQP